MPVPSGGGDHTTCRFEPSAFTCQMPCPPPRSAMKIALPPSGDQLAMKWSSKTLRVYGPASTVSLVSFGSAATISQVATVEDPKHLSETMHRANKMRPLVPGTTARAGPVGTSSPSRVIPATEVSAIRRFIPASSL
jgi:hypothetical protein